MSDSLFATPRLIENVDSCNFYHTMEIPGHGLVQGHFDLRPVVDGYLGGVPFAGKRVLKIGPASGYLTFEMERRGASVASVDLPEDVPWSWVPYRDDLIAQWVTGQRQHMEELRNGYWFAHRHFGSNSKVHYGDSTRLPAELGRYDYGVVAAVMLHNRDPLGMLQSCARLVDDRLVIVEQYHEDLEATGRAVMQLCPTRENQMVHTWWSFSPQLFRQFLEIQGFRETSFAIHDPQFASEPGGESETLRHFTMVLERFDGV